MNVLGILTIATITISMIAMCIGMAIMMWEGSELQIKVLLTISILSLALFCLFGAFWCFEDSLKEKESHGRLNYPQVVEKCV